MNRRPPALRPDLWIARERWQELAGELLTPRKRVGPIGTALSSMRAVPIGGGAANPCFVFIRKEEGVGCDWKAQIAGWYAQDIAAGGACIGQAAVLSALNAAASGLCRQHECPAACPCGYVPRLKLGTYTCTATLEQGCLMQESEDWNCQCLGV